ncbi:MAG: phenylacetate--CoA ligase [Firmicutes bacterium]|nr:phenylacetate--CoA ligase [Bacillota bacterium]
MPIWNPKYETMSREELEKLQYLRLKKTLELVYQRVPFYQKAFKEKGIEPGDIKSLADLSKLPFTTKEDLRQNYPFGLFAVPLQEVVRLHSSSGTTGQATVVGYTRNDLETWSELIARTLSCSGATANSVIQIAYGYGLFTGGLGLHYGAEKLGATVIPISGGQTKKQVRIMVDFQTTVLACTPSYALYIAETIEEMGIKPEELKLKAGVFGAEPWTESMRRVVEEKLNIDAIDIYGLSEVMGPGISSECLQKDGLHIFEDHFLPEIIDPHTGEVLPDGETGELVLTTLTKEAIPVIRYRTRDITSLKREKCPCGRTMVRMAKVSGRTDDMLIIRGVNVFPSQIEAVLMDLGQTEPHYQIVVDREGSLDTLTVLVEVSEQMFSDKVKGLEELEKVISRELESNLAVKAKVTLVEPKSLQRSEGKAKRVIDKRNL